jgi:signal transduction histidine kinase
MVFNIDLELVMVDGEELNKIGLKKSDFEGKSIEAIQVFSKKRKQKMKENVRKTFEGQHLSFETDYGEDTFSVNSIPLIVDKKITWALFVYSNISEQKRAERNIKEALKKEQELNELKSRFVSMASHEFRTPLTAILSAATLISRQNQPGKEERREKYVKQIASNVQSLVVILNDFLSLGILEEGKAVFQPATIDLVHLSKLVVDEIKTSKKDGQKIVIDHDQPTILVTLDPKLIRHILVNLISNAIKYSAENTIVDIMITSQDNKVLIQVSDQGIGIPSEEYDNMFDRFFRAKNADNIQGTGLGLHIVKQYTELMGGTVWFKSEVGKGSTFFVEFEMDDLKKHATLNT